MATFISHSPADTEALGEAWGRQARTGWVLGLAGELGAGKTQLVKGLARGLGISARVHSPTFALVNVYTGGRLPLFHLDLYRLDTRAQIAAAGLEEYLQADGVTVIEWAEKLFPELCLPPLATHAPCSTPHASPVALRWVELQISSASDRRITYEDIGA
jgi:tRNA threonylcarbamoyladenosine biosynthesis protein TsaE